MRSIRKHVQLLLLTSVFVCLGPFASFATETTEDFSNAIGEVLYLRGTVTAQQPDGKTRKLELNKQVLPKDVIITGTKSNVEIVFKDKSVLSQGANSSTSLNDYVYSDTSTASKMLFKMGTGTFRYVTGRIVKYNPTAFALQTPTTAIGIRGTEIFIEATPEQEEIGVLDMTPGHEVDISTTQDKKTITRAGYSIKATPDGLLSNPTPTASETRARIMKAAPQITQGEAGAVTRSKTDLDRKVDAFAAVINRTKANLGNLDDWPDYGDIHNIKLQQASQKTAKRNRDQNTDSGLGGGNGNDRGGVGGVDGGGGGGGPTDGP